MAKITSLEDFRRRDIPPEFVELIERIGGDIRGAAEEVSVFLAECTAAESVHQFESPVVAPESTRELAAELGIELPPGDLPAITEQDARQMVREILAACAVLANPDAAAVAMAFARYSTDDEVPPLAREIAGRCDAGADAARLAAMGHMKPVKAWHGADAYGDQANIVVEFAGPKGVAGEGIIALLDWGRGRGYLKDLFTIPRAAVAEALKELRRSAAGSRGIAAVASIDPTEALRLVAGCLQRSVEDGDELPLDEESRHLHRGLARRLAELGIEADIAPPMSEQQRDAAVAEFLDSNPGRALLAGPDAIGRDAAERWARVFAEYGADDERGLPLRIGGWKTEEFLFTHLDDAFDIRAADARALGATVRAWTEWRIDVEGLTGVIAERLRVTTDSMTREFERQHRVDDGPALFEDDRPAKPASKRKTPRTSRTIVGSLLKEGDPMVVSLFEMAEDPDMRAELEKELGADQTSKLLELLRADPTAGVMLLMAALGGTDGPGHEIELPGAFAAETPDPEGPGRTLQLRIDLRHMKPPVWRRLLVPGQASLGDLHDAIQIAFDWDGDHLHAFEELTGGWRRRTFAPLDELDADYDEDEWEVQALLAAPGDKLEYVYDFGDDWRHVIKVEQVVETPSDVIRCIGGRRAAPQEDTGYDEDGNWAPEPDGPFGQAEIDTIDAALQEFGPV